MNDAIMRPEEERACARLAARAFENYDFFSAYVPDGKRRSRFLRGMLDTEYRVNRGLAHIFALREGGEIIATAIVRDPSYRMPSEGQYLAAGFWKCLVSGGYRSVAAWYDMERRAGEPCAALAADSWYLHLLAVEPGAAGRGVGSRMLREHIVPYVRARGGASICLYTNAERNCRFYEKNGFECFHEQRFRHRGRSFGSWSFRMELERR